jgi:hypothetical protein
MRRLSKNRTVVSVAAIALAIGLALAPDLALALQGGGNAGGSLPGAGNGGAGGSHGAAHSGDQHRDPGQDRSADHRHDGEHPREGDSRDAYYQPDSYPRPIDDPLHLLRGYGGPRPHDAYFEDHRLSGLIPDWRDWLFGPLFTFHSYGPADSQCIRRDVFNDVYRAC